MIRASAVSIGIVDIDSRYFSLVIAAPGAGNRSRSFRVAMVLPRRQRCGRETWPSRRFRRPEGDQQGVAVTSVGSPEIDRRKSQSLR
jgi:hypothetical protein